MQDRFKFRVWDKINKIWVKNFSIDEQGFVEGFYNPQQAMNRRLALMQCTGLKDKNGKLIYEGDIIRFIDAQPTQAIEICNCGVFFIERGGFYRTIPLNRLPKNADKSITQEDVEHISGRFGVDMCKGFHFLSGEIIGNIYENPELLEGEKCS